MEVEFEDPALERLATDSSFTGGYDVAIVKAFRKRIQLIHAALDERDFRAMRSINFEKLKGNREGQHSMRLNDQWRLIVRLQARAPGKTVVVVEIVDYH
jgi:toxin HigB-1